MEPEWFDPNVQTLSSHLWSPKAQAFLAEQDGRVSTIFLNQKQVGTSCSSLEMLGCFLRNLGIRQGCEPSPTERIQQVVSVKAAGKGDRCRLFSSPITEREVTPVSPVAEEGQCTISRLAVPACSVHSPSGWADLSGSRGRPNLSAPTGSSACPTPLPWQRCQCLLGLSLETCCPCTAGVAGR